MTGAPPVLLRGPAGRLAVISFLLALAFVTGPARAQAKNPLVRTVGPAEIDWEAGTVSVRAGGAANLRLPGPDAARPAARRAAEKAAATRLGEALRTLALGGGRRLTPALATAAAARAKVKDVEYQSNGGVLLTLELDFADLTTPPKSERPVQAVTAPARRPDAAVDVDAERAPPDEAEPLELVIAVASMPLEVAPRIYSGGVEHTLGSAVYRLGEAPRTGRRVYTAKRDRQGRLTFAAPAAVIRQLDGARATIFLRSVKRAP